jgi:hypothetical protein
MSNWNQFNSTPQYVKVESINPSISRMPPSRICYSPDSPVHGVPQSIYPYHWDIIPLFQQDSPYLVESSGGIPTPPYSPVHFVPQMFDWGHIWTVRRPIEWVNVMIGGKILTNSGYIGAGRNPAGKLGDAVAQMELQPSGGFHPYILRLLNYRLSQSTATLTREISLPRI